MDHFLLNFKGTGSLSGLLLSGFKGKQKETRTCHFRYMKVCLSFSQRQGDMFVLPPPPGLLFNTQVCCLDMLVPCQLVPTCVLSAILRSDHGDQAGHADKKASHLTYVLSKTRGTHSQSRGPGQFGMWSFDQGVHLLHDSLFQWAPVNGIQLAPKRKSYPRACQRPRPFDPFDSTSQYMSSQA